MALSADRITAEKGGGETAYPVYQSTTIYKGGMVAINSSGYAIPATTTAGLEVVGVAVGQADNSSGSDGDIYVQVAKHRKFAMDNSGTNAVDQDDVGHICYVEDDQTVCDVNAGSAVIAGIVEMIDPVTSKVWVYIPGAEAASGGADQVSGIDTVTSGALSLNTRTSKLSITGTKAFTLANGLYEGQRKTVIVSATASTPAGTLTPATYADGTNVHLSAVGEWYEFEYHDSGGWKLINFRRSERGAETVTSGALSLFTRVSKLSVTGTKAFTLADGLFIGQRKTVIVSAVASTPAGTLTPTNYSDGTSEHFSAVGEMLELEFDGTNWHKVDFHLSQRSDETVTTGALSLFTKVSKLSITGTKAFTLADGLFTGQEKFVVVTAAASTPAGTLTPTNYSDGTSEHFAAVGEMLHLVWDGTNWKKVSFRLGVAGAEIVTSGALSVYTLVSLISVTGTVSYSLADGLYPGQMKFCRCTVAASTPDGTLTPAHPTGFATADFDATEEAYCFIWNGAGWDCAYVIGGALS